jgi:hypothetical protein
MRSLAPDDSTSPILFEEHASFKKLHPGAVIQIVDASHDFSKKSLRRDSSGGMKIQAKNSNLVYGNFTVLDLYNTNRVFYM